MPAPVQGTRITVTIRSSKHMRLLILAGVSPGFAGTAGVEFLGVPSAAVPSMRELAWVLRSRRDDQGRRSFLTP